MVKIRFSLFGSKKKRTFRIVAIDERKSRNSGNFIEYLGFYNPHSKETNISKFKENIDKWIKLGAKTTKSVSDLIARICYHSTNTRDV